MLSSCFCKWASGEVGAHHSPMYSDEKHVRQQYSPCRSHECVAVHVRVLDMATMNRHAGHSAAGCRWRGPFSTCEQRYAVCVVCHTLAAAIFPLLARTRLRRHGITSGTVAKWAGFCVGFHPLCGDTRVGFQGRCTARLEGI